MTVGQDVRGELVEILLVEDRPSDVRLTQEALREGKVRNRLSVARDGEEALRFLRRESPYEDAPRPDLVFLDLNLPKVDGRQVLAQMKSDPKLKTIPVVVLTTSKAEEDVMRAYEHHANCFITKPIDLEQFISVVRYVEDFWLGVVRLPPK